MSTNSQRCGGGRLRGEEGNEWKSPTSPRKSAARHAVVEPFNGGLNMNEDVLWAGSGARLGEISTILEEDRPQQMMARCTRTS